MNLIFTCGGTAGHISPALAVAKLAAERDPSVQILFVGADDGMETDLVPRAGYQLETVRISNFQRKLTPSGIWHNIKAVCQMILSRQKASRIIRNFKPDVIIGTGGYASYPVLRQGSKMGIPTAIHESNAVPGLTTKLVMNHVDKIMVSFADSVQNYPDPANVEVVGMPVNELFFATGHEDARQSLSLDNRPLIVSFWGSLGAREMNRRIADFMKLECENNYPWQHIHATGSYGWKWMPALINDLGINTNDSGIDIREFIYNMPEVMAAADIIICRAGAATIAETAAAGKPVIFIPSPNVTGNHQEKNARIIANNGGAIVCRENECTGESLYKVVSDLLSGHDEITSMGDAIHRMAVRDSAERILEIIEDLASRNTKGQN